MASELSPSSGDASFPSVGFFFPSSGASYLSSVARDQLDQCDGPQELAGAAAAAACPAGRAFLQHSLGGHFWRPEGGWGPPGACLSSGASVAPGRPWEGRQFSQESSGAASAGARLPIHAEGLEGGRLHSGTGARDAQGSCEHSRPGIWEVAKRLPSPRVAQGWLESGNEQVTPTGKFKFSRRQHQD